MNLTTAEADADLGWIEAKAAADADYATHDATNWQAMIGAEPGKGVRNL